MSKNTSPADGAGTDPQSVDDAVTSASTKPRISVIGTGYLGATHAAAMAEMGFDVIGVDNDMRASFFGPAASTHRTTAELTAALPTFRHHGLDIRDREGIDRLFREAGPQLAIVDLMLHGTNGFELARSLRKMAPDVGVILTSDYHFSPTQLERMDCGAIAFVPRPFALAELAVFLRSKLDGRPDSARRPHAF